MASSSHIHSSSSISDDAPTLHLAKRQCVGKNRDTNESLSQPAIGEYDLRTEMLEDTLVITLISIYQERMWILSLSDTELVSKLTNQVCHSFAELETLLKSANLSEHGASLAVMKYDESQDFAVVKVFLKTPLFERTFDLFLQIQDTPETLKEKTLSQLQSKIIGLDKKITSLQDQLASTSEVGFPILLVTDSLSNFPAIPDEILPLIDFWVFSASFYSFPLRSFEAYPIRIDLSPAGWVRSIISSKEDSTLSSSFFQIQQLRLQTIKQRYLGWTRRTQMFSEQSSNSFSSSSNPGLLGIKLYTSEIDLYAPTLKERLNTLKAVGEIEAQSLRSRDSYYQNSYLYALQALSVSECTDWTSLAGLTINGVQCLPLLLIQMKPPFHLIFLDPQLHLFKQSNDWNGSDTQDQVKTISQTGKILWEILFAVALGSIP